MGLLSDYFLADYLLVVPGSLWPAARCTSSSVSPFSSAVVMKVARIECAETPRPSPMALAYLRSTRSMASFLALAIVT